MRPAREAVILRRLVAQAGDRFPRAVLVRMWRELLAATTRQQTPVSVAVYAPAGRSLGSGTSRATISARPRRSPASESAGQAIRAVSDGVATVAVLPLPHDDDAWWLALISDQPDRLRVFGRLPFVAGRPADGEEPRALALGRLEPEPSGDDLALLAIEAESGISRGRLRALMAAAGLRAGMAVTWRSADPPPGGASGRGRQLRARWRRAPRSAPGARRRGEVLRIVAVGGYPRPLPPD